MKNVFKLGFLALAIAVSLTACDFFSSKPKPTDQDTTKTDTSKIDTSKINTQTLDTAKTNADSK